MNCGCEKSESKTKFSILKGKKNLLNLIRGIGDPEEGEEDEVVKTETLQDETSVDTSEFEQNTEVDENTDTIEEGIELKRLKHILDKIEQLRYNANST